MTLTLAMLTASVYRPYCAWSSRRTSRMPATKPIPCTTSCVEAKLETRAMRCRVSRLMACGAASEPPRAASWERRARPLRATPAGRPPGTVR